MGNRSGCLDFGESLQLTKRRMEAYYLEVKQISERHGNRPKRSLGTDKFSGKMMNQFILNY